MNNYDISQTQLDNLLQYKQQYKLLPEEMKEQIPKLVEVVQTKQIIMHDFLLNKFKTFLKEKDKDYLFTQMELEMLFGNKQVNGINIYVEDGLPYSPMIEFYINYEDVSDNFLYKNKQTNGIYNIQLKIQPMFLKTFIRFIPEHYKHLDSKNDIKFVHPNILERKYKDKMIEFKHRCDAIKEDNKENKLQIIIDFLNKFQKECIKRNKKFFKRIDFTFFKDEKRLKSLNNLFILFDFKKITKEDILNYEHNHFITFNILDVGELNFKYCELNHVIRKTLDELLSQMLFNKNLPHEKQFICVESFFNSNIVNYNSLLIEDDYFNFYCQTTNECVSLVPLTCLPFNEENKLQNYLETIMATKNCLKNHLFFDEKVIDYILKS